VLGFSDNRRSRWLLECGIRSQLSSYSGSDADVEVVMAEKDFLALMRRELNPQLAFLERKLLIRGKTKHVLRFNLLLELLIDEANGLRSEFVNC